MDEQGWGELTMWECLHSVDAAGNGCFEDRAGMSGNLAWVLDGASSVFPDQISSAQSDAQWLVDHLAGHLEDLAAEAVPLEKLVATAIERTATEARQQWRLVPEVPPSAALGVVRRAGDRTEFLVLADVSVIMRTDAGVFELIDRRVEMLNGPAHEQMLTALSRPGSTFASVSQVTRPLLAEARRTGMNRKGGYWVASIDEGAVDHALTGALDGVREVILASDGFMRAVHLFDLVADVESLFTSDLTAVAKEVRGVERADPDVRRYPRWSVTDDICARRLVWVD